MVLPSRNIKVFCASFARCYLIVLFPLKLMNLFRHLFKVFHFQMRSKNKDIAFRSPFNNVKSFTYTPSLEPISSRVISSSCTLVRQCSFSSCSIKYFLSTSVNSFILLLACSMISFRSFTSFCN